MMSDLTHNAGRTLLEVAVRVAAPTWPAMRYDAEDVLLPIVRNQI